VPDNDAIAKKGVLADTLGAVDELVGDDDVAGGDDFPEASNGRNGDDPLDAQFFHAVYVGAVVDFRRQVAVSAPVTGQKHHPHAVQHTGDVFVGRITERS